MSWLRSTSLVLLALIIAAPMVIASTLMLIPFWSWFEARTGLESLGHSGPAGWCYVALYAATLLLIFCARRWITRTRAVQGPSSGT
jgi:TRAP-type C4-dicarboxylate transport system permease small subunit